MAPSQTTRRAWLTALALGASSLAAIPSASASTITDDFTGSSGGVPAGWSDFGPDQSGPIVEGGGFVTISDGRGNNPHLMLSQTSVGSVTAFTFTVEVASTTSFPDTNPMTGLSSEPQVIAAVGAFDGFAVVVQFNAVSKTFTAFINGPTQGRYTFPGVVPGYSGGAFRFVVKATSDRFRITAPAYGYDSGDLLFSAAGVAGFNTLSDLGANAQLLIGTESAGNVANGTLSSIAFDRVTLDYTPVVAPPVSGTTIVDNFAGNSGGVPASWSDIGQDTNPASTVVESGNVVTITDTRGNGGPQFIQRNVSVGGLTDFTVKVDITSMKSSPAANRRRSSQWERSRPVWKILRFQLRVHRPVQRDQEDFPGVHRGPHDRAPTPCPARCHLMPAARLAFR